MATFLIALRVCRVDRDACRSLEGNVSSSLETQVESEAKREMESNDDGSTDDYIYDSL